MKQMFRIVLISFVVALSLSSPLIPDVGDVLNEITDITDNVTDAVKAVNFLIGVGGQNLLSPCFASKT